MYYDIEESGKRLKKLRKGKNMTQRELADVLDIHVKTISKAERGVNGMSIDNLILYSEWFDVSIDYIVLGGEEHVDDEITKLINKCNGELRKKILQIINSIIKILN